jgi:CRP-like cAMP-binding protein
VREQAAIDSITEHGWLAACPPAFRAWAVANLRWRGFGAGDGITYAGDEDGGFYCVGDGQLSFFTGQGRADLGTSHFGLPGAWLGLGTIIGRTRTGWRRIRANGNI